MGAIISTRRNESTSYGKGGDALSLKQAKVSEAMPLGVSIPAKRTSVEYERPSLVMLEKARPVQHEDVGTLVGYLRRIVLFHGIEERVVKDIIAEMHTRHIPAGELIIQQGDTGPLASQLYVVKSGGFEVFTRQHHAVHITFTMY